jgi:uncharacterized protein YlbG (UPF0298 family)
MKPVNLHISTFGSTPACRNLARILNDTQISSRKVKRLLDKYNLDYIYASYIPNEETRKLTVKLLREHYVKQVDSTTLPEFVKSHMKNIIIAKHRLFLEVIKSLKSK